MVAAGPKILVDLIAPTVKAAGVLCRRASLAPALAYALDTVGTLEETVEDGIGDGEITGSLGPVIDRHLAGDDGRSTLVSVLDDLAQVVARRIIKLLRAAIVEDRQVCPGKSAQQLGVAVAAKRRAGRREQPRRGGSCRRRSGW